MGLMILCLCLLWVYPHPAWANVLSELKSIERLVFDQPTQAIERGKALAQTLTPESDPKGFVRLAVSMAEAAALFGDSREMERWIAQSLPLAEKHGMQREGIFLRSMKAVFFEFQGDILKAEQQHKASITLAKALGDERLEAYASVYLSFFYNRSQDFQQFSVLVNRIFQLYRKLPHDTTYYLFIAAIGNFYSDPFYKRLEESERYMREAIDYFDKHKMEFVGFNFTQSLSAIAMETDPEEALKILEDSERKYPLTQNPEYKVLLDFRRGQIYLGMKAYDKAIRSLNQAVTYWTEKQNNSGFKTRALFGLALSYTELGRYAEAWKYLQLVGETVDKQKIKFRFEFQQTKARVMQGLGRLQEENASRKAALELYTSYMDERSAEIARNAEAQFGLKMLEEQQKLLEAENKTKTLELDQAHRRQRVILGFASLMLLLLLLALISIQKSREVKARKQEIQDILDTIEEGILRIGPDLRILADHSRYAELLLGTADLQGRLLIQVLFDELTPSEDISVIEQSLGCIIGESRVSWDLNSVHLPRQIKRQGQILSVLWQPIVNGQGLITMLIVAIRDITQQSALEKAFQLEREQNADFLEKFGEIQRIHPERACQFLLAQLNWIHEQTGWSEERLRDSSYRADLHTRKGTARTLGLATLSHRIHELEQALLPQDPPTSREIILDQQSLLKVELGRYQRVVESVYSKVKTSDHKDLLGLCSEAMQEPLSQLQDAGIAFGGITVRDEYASWKPDRIEVLRGILVHAFTNSIDHGFIRAGLHKDPKRKACFSITARRGAEGLVLEFRDNGAGIAWDRVNSKAEAQGMKNASRRELAAFLFQDGSSTAEDVNLLSGRGLGLSAIGRICLSLGGEAQITDNDQGSGTLLMIRIPEKGWQKVA